MIVGDSALRKLALMKLRGGMRRQLKRLKTPSGFIFATVGGLLSVVWISTLLMGRGTFTGELPQGPELRTWTELGLFIFVALTGLSAVAVRGLYLPKQEIERFFSAPLTRADLVRYRMMVDFARTLFGAVVLGLLTFQRMPVPLFGFLGAMIAVFTLGVFRQSISLVLGDARSRLGKWLKGRRLVGMRIVLGLAVWFLLMALFLGDRYTDRIFGELELRPELGEKLLEHPVVRALFLPLRPWSSLMTAGSWPEFLRWGAICVGLWLLLYEGTARLPIDFREQSLETSEEIARRLKRVGRGGALSGGNVSSRAAARRVPWFFGRGPGGAVAWIKLASIARKARGTLLVALLIVCAVTVGVSVLLGATDSEAGEGAAVAGPLLIAFLGIMYLSGTLRFDFRSDLDHMESIKAWPVHPRRVFVATLLPQVVLISGTLAVALVLRAAVLGLFHPVLWAMVLALPLVEFAWLAVDNIVFLFAPVRFVPGQEGTLHHSGRAIVLFLLRMLLVALTLGLIAAPAALVFWVGPEVVGLSEDGALWASILIGFGVLLVEDWVLAWVGGRMLRRFDVARDRGEAR